MKLSIHLHVAGLSLSGTASVLERFDVERACSPVHWVQKAGLQPGSRRTPDHAALDETVVRLDDQRYWLYAAVDPRSNECLPVRLCPTRTTALTTLFLQELTEKHDIEETCFSSTAHPG